MATDFIKEILKENAKRNAVVYAHFDPISGSGSIGGRKRVEIEDFPIKVQFIPVEMLEIPLVKKLIKHGSIDSLLWEIKKEEHAGEKDFDVEEYEYNEEEYDADRLKVINQFVRLRSRYDFPFWAAFYVYIKKKGGGEDVLFRLTRPQRRFVEKLETFRKANKPIRLVLLKARQWGGSTTSQIYMAWLQMMHKVGLNSLIIAHQGAGSDEIKDMFDRMIKAYPVDMLHKLGDKFSENEPKLIGVGKSGSIYRVPQRNCKIKIGTAERPDSCRGGDYNLVHLSEVGLWKSTDGKKPEDIVQSACSGIMNEPYTMIVYESTAKGSGTFFHKEYLDAKDPAKHSQFDAIFISFFDIDNNRKEIDDIKEFARKLYTNRNNTSEPSRREESGRYLWSLWEKGATLEAINWYIIERAKFTSHASMASECPADDVEAFVHSGEMVFDAFDVEKLRKKCKKPKFIGDVYGDELKGKRSLSNLRFRQDSQGLVYIWNLPEIDPDERITDRYLVTVDVGGYSDKADYSVIVVFDRLFMMDGGLPMVVAQWYGHIEIDLLAWKAAQIAAFYDNALLVIEKNTVDKHDHERQRIDDNYEFLLIQLKDVYDNLYARPQSEDDIREGLPRKYGFHTNIATKPMIIETLKMVIREQQYIERDEQCINEYLVYERKQNGSFGAVVGAHDDLLMTRAIGLRVCFYEMELPKAVKRVGRFMIKRKRAVSAATI